MQRGAAENLLSATRKVFALYRKNIAMSRSQCPEPWFLSHHFFQISCALSTGVGRQGRLVLRGAVFRSAFFDENAGRMRALFCF
jgi:hypothetical protein